MMKRQSEPSSFGKYVRGVMNAHNLEATDVSERAEHAGFNLPASTLNNILRARTPNPRISTLKGIAAGLGVPVQQVVGAAFGIEESPLEKDQGVLADAYRRYLLLSDSQKARLTIFIQALSSSITTVAATEASGSQEPNGDSGSRRKTSKR